MVERFHQSQRLISSLVISSRSDSRTAGARFAALMFSRISRSTSLRGIPAASSLAAIPRSLSNVWTASTVRSDRSSAVIRVAFCLVSGHDAAFGRARGYWMM